ncbi:hypothetical protein [Paenibacillus sp. DYY-L-2]|uniref:hypothetical protein n=1 Tax=Paenibacillus sp. DYY-L-2 TaxID=3447013 RepID=UPI003F4FC5B4
MHYAAWGGKGYNIAWRQPSDTTSCLAVAKQYNMLPGSNNAVIPCGSAATKRCAKLLPLLPLLLWRVTLARGVK